MEEFALAVIGSGSGNVVLTDEITASGKVALVESGAFGGTCINRGCIPTKMFVYTADLAMQVRSVSQFGLAARLERVDWPAIRNRIITRVDETSLAGRKAGMASANVTVFEGWARFAGPHELVVNDAHIMADEIVIATGGRPAIPPVVASRRVEFHTSDTIMRLDALPASMVILGGGYIAVELAHVFSSFGVDIRIVAKGATLVAALDAEVSKQFTEQAAERWDVHLGATAIDVRRNEDGIVVVLEDGNFVAGELLLVATGRQPNTDDINLDVGWGVPPR